MADASAYQGSQAFNQGANLNESVTPNTGSLSLSKAIVALRGIHEAIGLTLNLSYAAGSRGMLGLPDGWGWGLSYVIPNASLTTQGKTSIIDPAWSDAGGYQSGLRYVNNHGMQFQDIVPPQPLPSGRSGSYAFRLRYTDGAMDYFDATGKLAEHADRYGNALSYYYVDPFAGPLDNRLDHIVDSFGQQVRFGYGPNAIVVSTPDGAQATINWSAQGVQSVVDAIGSVTSFEYMTAAGRNVVAAVHYPTGLSTRMQYVPLAYLDAEGAARSFVAVSDLFHLDAAGNRLDHTAYAFGTDSGGATFTGASAGYRLGSGSDSLMDSNNNAYVYDVLVRRLDAEGEAAAASRIYYNYLHLPVREEHYLAPPGGALGDGYRAIYTYRIDPDYHARTTAYTQPVVVEQFVHDDLAGAWRALRKSTSSYDAFGQLLASEEFLYDAGRKAYVSQLQTSIRYQAASWGGELPALEIHADQVAGGQRQVSYVLTPDGASIASAAVSWRADAGAGWLPWKTRSSSFDAQGRVLAETLAWSPGATVPQGSVASATSTHRYEFDAARRLYASTVLDPLGNATTTVCDVGLATGPLVATRQPLGQTTSARYDAIGRLVATVDPLGHETTTSYTIDKDGNSVSTLGPTDYLLRQDFDALGRPIALSDNGDPTRAGSATPNRILRTSAYDMLGRVARAANELGLAMQYQYDALGRVVQRLDPLGNRTVTRWLDGQLMSEDYLNGIQKSSSMLDGFGRTVSLLSYADPADANIGHARRLDTVYDGFGLARARTLYTQSLADDSLALLQQVDYDFDAEAALARERFSGRLGSRVDVVRSHVYELSGQAVAHAKTTSYADERRFDNRSDAFAFDAAGRLASAVNALGQEERYAYDANGRLSRRVRYDGTAFDYAYDDNGQQLSMSWPGGSVGHSYLANGRTAGMQLGGATLAYEYTLDGSASAIVFPDGSRQSYVLDATSRVTSAVDASGAVSGIAYDSAGRIASRSHGADTLTYQYGTVNHAFGVHLGDTLTGPSASLARKLAFDGFGQPASALTLDGGGHAVLASSYGRDALGRVTGLKLSSQTSNAPAVNLARTAVYDGVNQLLSSTTAYGGSQPADTLAYVYDGNYNVLARSQDGAVTRYTYNAIDQLSGAGVRYDANGRMTADGTGATYAYNALDQMVSATAPGGASVAYAYYPDGAMARRTSAGAAQGFYYDSGAVNAVSSNAGWTSFLLDATLRRGAYGAGATGYYVAGADSTAMLQGEGGASEIGYDPYGAALDGAGFGAERNFTWNQEYTDPSTGLVYLRTRNYHPGLMRFCSMDSIQQDNRYAYARGNPLNLADPSGHMDTGEIIGLVAGAVVGLIATVATGGAAGAAAAAIFGTESLAASIGATAVAGAVGSVAGDATNAAITHQSFTAQRALTDILSGAIGGAVGAGAGGVAGRASMSAALAEGLSQRAITNIGLVCSGVVGGVAGSAASSAVTSGMSGTPFFSAGTALSMVVGAAAGAGGGFLTSGAYLGKMSSRIIPVPLTDAETHLIVPARNTVGAVLDKQLFVMAPQDDADFTAGRFGRMKGGYRAATTLDYKAGSPTYDTIAAHGAGNTMFASVEYRPGGMTTGEPNYVRPIKGGTLGGYLSANPGLIGGTGSDNPIKLMSCFGAFSNAQSIAATLQRPVFAGYPAINRYSFTGWELFPRG